MTENSLRLILNMIITVVIPYYLFTVDADIEESRFDQVKDFTALMILVDLDNTLAATSGIKFEALHIFEHYTLLTKDENEEMDKVKTLQKWVDNIS